MSKFSRHIDTELLTAYLHGELSGRALHKVETWVNASEENKAEFETLQAAWDLSDDFLPEPMKVDTDEAWARLSVRIDEAGVSEKGKATGKGIWNLRQGTLLKVAAIVLPLLVLSILLTYRASRPAMQSLATSETVEEISLPDGSRVSVNKDSRLEYPIRFGRKDRVVELSGEAFFQVESFPDNPFIVLTKNARIRVLGTSFYVKAYPETELVEVFVKTGLVVQYQMENERVIDSLHLGPGEKGVLNMPLGKLVKVEEVDENQWFWSSKTLAFIKTPLEEVFRIIEEAYDVDIRVEEKSIETLRLTGRYSSLPVEEVLEIIVESFNLSLSQSGTTFEIHVEKD